MSKPRRPRKPKTPPKRLTRARRREAVEAKIRAEGWSYEIALQLVASTGWSRATIYRDKDAVLSDLAAELDDGLPQRRALFLADLERLTRDAADANQYSPAARMMGMKAQVLGIDKPPPPELPPATEGDGLDGVLEVTRRMRRQAEAAGSYVAAASLLKEERDMVKEIEADRRARDEEAMAASSDDELVEKLASIIANLSDERRKAIVAKVRRAEKK